MIDLLVEGAPVILALIVYIAAMYSGSKQREFVGVVFVVLQIVHMGIFLMWWGATGEKMDGLTYYVFASLFSVAGIELIIMMAIPTDTSVTFMRIYTTEIVLNMLGLSGVMMWHWVYLTLAIALHAWAVIALLRKDKADESGGYKVDTWVDYTRLFTGAGRVGYSKGEKTP